MIRQKLCKHDYKLTRTDKGKPFVEKVMVRERVVKSHKVTVFKTYYCQKCKLIKRERSIQEESVSR